MVKRATTRRIKPPGKRKRSRTQIKTALVDAFRKDFPNDTVDVSDGYQDNIHLLVVSRKFDDMDEAQKQDMLWSIIDRSPLTEEEKQLISLVLPLSPAQIK